MPKLSKKSNKKVVKKVVKKSNKKSNKKVIKKFNKKILIGGNKKKCSKKTNPKKKTKKLIGGDTNGDDFINWTNHSTISETEVCNTNLDLNVVIDKDITNYMKNNDYTNKSLNIPNGCGNTKFNRMVALQTLGYFMKGVEMEQYPDGSLSKESICQTNYDSIFKKYYNLLKNSKDGYEQNSRIDNILPTPPGASNGSSIMDKYHKQKKTKEQLHLEETERIWELNNPEEIYTEEIRGKHLEEYRVRNP
jgi:hypothetical protein